MNLKLLAGIALFVIGLVLAIVGIAKVGTGVDEQLIVTENNTSEAVSNTLGTIVLPAISGLSLAVGGLLLGLSLGNWKHPRTHLEAGDQLVDPEGYHKMKHV